jgi:hypothetical protein
VKLQLICTNSSETPKLPNKYYIDLYFRNKSNGAKIQTPVYREWCNGNKKGVGGNNKEKRRRVCGVGDTTKKNNWGANLSRRGRRAERTLKPRILDLPQKLFPQT